MTGLRNLVVVLGVLILGVPGLGAQEVVVLDSFTIPEAVFVGDEFELRLRIRVPDGSEIRPPESMPEASWGDILNIRFLERPTDVELVIRAVSFVPGNLSMPPLDLFGVTVKDILFFVESSIDEGRSTLQPVKEQTLLPGAELWIAFMVILLLLVPIFSIGLFRWLRVVGPRLLRSFSLRRPYRRIRSILGRLQRDGAEMADRDFYITLLDEIRRYLSLRLAPEVLSATTEELSFLLNQPTVPSEKRIFLVGLFQFGDRVKFANELAGGAMRLRHVQDCERNIRELERSFQEAQRKKEGAQS